MHQAPFALMANALAPLVTLTLLILHCSKTNRNQVYVDGEHENLPAKNQRSQAQVAGAEHCATVQALAAMHVVGPGVIVVNGNNVHSNCIGDPNPVRDGMIPLLSVLQGLAHAARRIELVCMFKTAYYGVRLALAAVPLPNAFICTLPVHIGNIGAGDGRQDRRGEPGWLAHRPAFMATLSRPGHYNIRERAPAIFTALTNTFFPPGGGGLRQRFVTSASIDLTPGEQQLGPIRPPENRENNPGRNLHPTGLYYGKDDFNKWTSLAVYTVVRSIEALVQMTERIKKGEGHYPNVFPATLEKFCEDAITDMNKGQLVEVLKERFVRTGRTDGRRTSPSALRDRLRDYQNDPFGTVIEFGKTVICKNVARALRQMKWEEEEGEGEPATENTSSAFKSASNTLQPIGSPMTFDALVQAGSKLSFEVDEAAAGAAPTGTLKPTPGPGRGAPKPTPKARAKKSKKASAQKGKAPASRA
ncbi:hypothetical protein TeGR_g12537 [Tetraparma gracilis]|uniref:Uncharacterized protein n=1 Tax=Tetraparma gracilis TaxID=2962635 RepID=A0ABQ6N600_9STRA|nr:hypothetical protein TeGR_g12537 [Tetraparma gracilis]